MAPNSNTYTTRVTPAYVLYNHIYGRNVEIKSTTVVAPTTIYSHKETNRFMMLPFQPVHPNGFSVFSQVYPGTLYTQIPANQGLPTYYDFLSVPQETPMGRDFSSSTGTAMSSQSSSGPPGSWDGRAHSLHTQKYGPYICPKCNYLSETSQLFANHVKSHYKEETFQEKHARLVARVHKRSRTTLQGNNGGATVDPSNGKRARVMTSVKPEPEV